jgi:hypothetical protein
MLQHFQEHRCWHRLSMWNREGEYGEYGDGADRRGNTGIAIVLAGATDSCGGDAISCGASLKHNKVTASKSASWMTSLHNVLQCLATGGARATAETCLSRGRDGMYTR